MKRRRLPGPNIFATEPTRAYPALETGTALEPLCCRLADGHDRVCAGDDICPLHAKCPPNDQFEQYTVGDGRCRRFAGKYVDRTRQVVAA